jgi:hypothetical protein
MKAVRGETIIFPIAFDSPIFTVGFSTTTGPYQLSYVDSQFGTTYFRLLRDSGQPSCAPNEISDIELIPRWVTRAWPDPASPAGIANLHSQGLTPGIRSQVLAAIDIPDTMCPGWYTWSVRNDTPGPPSTIEGDLFRNAPTYGHRSFEIIAAAANGQPNLPEGYYEGITLPLQYDMIQLIPYHKVAWDVANPASSARPAAGYLRFQFPSSKISIKTVFEEHNLGRGSIVRWCVSGGTVPCPPDSNAADALGELHVHFVDPDEKVYRLSIAFALDPSATGPLWESDFLESNPERFGVVLSRFYDRDWNEVTSFYSSPPGAPVRLAGVW